MAMINMHEAKTRLSDLVARAEAGEEIVIARRNRPAARLVPVHRPGGPFLSKEGLGEAPEDVTGRQDIAADDRLFPRERDGMAGRIGFAEDKQSDYEAGEMRRAVEAGRAFTIMRGGKPVARVVPIQPEPKSRGWGAWEGRYRLPDTFFDPLPEDELTAWDGSDEPPA